MKLKFNKNDWSGEEATINVNQKELAWSQNGYRFRLELVEESSTVTKYEIKGDDWDDDYVLGTVTRWNELDHEFEASAESGECRRKDPSAFIAASQLLFNII